MKDFAGEFGAVSQDYHQLGEELSGALKANQAGGLRTLAGTILQSRDCLARIEQMNSRVLLLSQEWKEQRPHLDTKSRRQVDSLVQAAREQAIRLHELCRSQAEKLKLVKEQLERDLVETGKGARYLKSVKPVKNNYPKFIDSMY